MTGPELGAPEAQRPPVSCRPSPHQPPFLPRPSLSADVPTVEVLERELAWLKEHLSQLDSPVVFCHNDLLCKNIIYDSTKGTSSLALAGLGPRGGLPSGCRSSDRPLDKQKVTLRFRSQVNLGEKGKRK